MRTNRRPLRWRATAAAEYARSNRAHRAHIPIANPPGSVILWEINDFSPEWDSGSGGAKVIISGTQRPGLPEGLHLCCVFGHVEVPAEQISPVGWCGLNSF